MNKNSKLYNLQQIQDNALWLMQELEKDNPDTKMVEHYQQMVEYYGKKVWGKGYNSRGLGLK